MFPLSKKLPSENNKTYSYRAIKEGILSLQLQPGQALSVVDLAKALKISTTPIERGNGEITTRTLSRSNPASRDLCFKNQATINRRSCIYTAHF